jgi:hypothetical protein
MRLVEKLGEVVPQCNNLNYQQPENQHEGSLVGARKRQDTVAIAGDEPRHEPRLPTANPCGIARNNPRVRLLQR